jgi:shikimate kinase
MAEPQIDALVVSSACAVGLIPAYANGRGAVMAISARATSHLRATTPTAHHADLPSMAMACAVALLSRGSAGANWSACTFRSPLPHGIGLKTSSALAVGITKLAGAAIGRALDTHTTVQVALAVQAQLGLSQAGAFDDTWASAGGGLVVADARRNRLIARLTPPAVQIVILVPKFAEPWAHHIDRVALLQPCAAHVQKLIDRLCEGDVWGACTDSALFHSAKLRYRAEPLRVAMDAGALGVALSGKGPAIAAFTPPRAEREIVCAWREAFPDAEIFCTTPTSTGVKVHRANSMVEAQPCR